MNVFSKHFGRESLSEIFQAYRIAIFNIEVGCIEEFEIYIDNTNAFKSLSKSFCTKIEEEFVLDG